MKRIILIAILLESSKSATFWKEVGTGTPPIISVTITGPGEGYVVQGEKTVFTVYQMDWGSANAAITASVKDINLVGILSVETSARLQSDSNFNVVTSSETIFRFNAQPGVASNFEEYSVPKQAGKRYAYPFWAAQTNFMFISGQEFTSAADKKAYRLNSDRITDVKVFNTGFNSRSYGVLYGTNWFVISNPGAGHRKLYDYTNGYVGGTNSVVQTHSKPSTRKEMGFFSPEDGRDVYVVARRAGVKSIFTVKNDGTELINRNLNAIGFEIHFPKWIKDTDLCVTGSWGTKFAIFNFMDVSKPAPTIYTLDDSGSQTYQAEVWKDFKTIILSSRITDKSYVYKTLTETPCSDLCATCDGVFRKKCLTCVSHSTKSGDVCNCDIGFYSNNISPYTQECLACSTLCGTCSGNGPTQCLSCRYPLMEKKGDGTCGCPDGKYRSGTSCLDCDSSCKTCSGGSSNECLSCNLSDSRYFESNRCPLCHSLCKTCRGPGSKECLSCFPGYFLNSESCFSCSSLNSADCPEPLQFTLPLNYEELTQNITITIFPSIQDPLQPGHHPSVDSLIENHLIFKYKRKDQNERPLTILEKRLTHDNGRSVLFIQFLEKMRAYNTEYVSFEVKDPWLYRAPEGEVDQKYFTSKSKNIKSTWRRRKRLKRRRTSRELLTWYELQLDSQLLSLSS